MRLSCLDAERVVVGELAAVPCSDEPEESESNDDENAEKGENGDDGEE